MEDTIFEEQFAAVLSQVDEADPSNSYLLLSEFHEADGLTEAQKERINSIRFYFGAQKIVTEEARFEEGLKMMEWAGELLEVHGAAGLQKLCKAYQLYYHAIVFLRRKEHQSAFEKIQELQAFLKEEDINNDYLRTLALLTNPEIKFIKGTTLINAQDWEGAKEVIEAAANETSSIAEQFTSNELLANTYRGIAYYYRGFYDFNRLLDAFLKFDVNSPFIDPKIKVNFGKAIEYMGKGELSIFVFKGSMLAAKSMQIIADILIDQKHQLVKVQNSFDSKEVINRRFYSVHLERDMGLAIQLLTEAKLGIDVLLYQRIKEFIINIDKFLANIYSTVSREIQSSYETNLQGEFSKVRDLVSEGDLEEAMHVAFQTINNRELIDRIILLQSRYNRAKNADRMGLATKDQVDVEMNKVTLTLLEMLTKLEQEVEHE
ncbi:MAG: hypothetical protein AAGH79_16790 [Bacteroidota bacterium]